MGANHPNVRSAETNKKRSMAQRGRPQTLAHTQAKVKAASRQRVMNDEQWEEAQRMRNSGATLQTIATLFNTTPMSVSRYFNNKVKGVL